MLLTHQNPVTPTTLLEKASSQQRLNKKDEGGSLHSVCSGAIVVLIGTGVLLFSRTKPTIKKTTPTLHLMNVTDQWQKEEEEIWLQAVSLEKVYVLC